MFLRQCIETDRYPKEYFKSLRRCKLRPTSESLKRIAETRLQTLRSAILNLKVAHSLLLSAVDDLNSFCRIKFYNHCKQTIAYVTKKQIKKNTLSLSTEQTLSNFSKNLDKYVKNFSNIVLNRTQKEALSVGLKFSIPPQKNHPVDVQT
ncbi:hypothetical protein P879_06587 [Paragonimus westermani]|uniref:Uncharacterized protein n=1 Tax=Paragonimus westermani TaxID=34504 RepID=A0A8T0DJ32_9TREM|nr:hypothetical protein P879_06587 [Paragonimus westermani]